MGWSKPWYEEYRERGGNPLPSDRLAYEIQNGRHVDNVLNWARAGAGVGVSVIAVASFVSAPNPSLSGAAVLSACLLAAIALGGLFGFLFGIPKSGAGAKPDGANEATLSSKPTNRVNTNLEEVSDWLTKLILGAGLTQIGALWSMFVDLSRRIGERGFADHSYGGAIAGGLIIYGLVVGFLAGYVLTRLYLSNIFLLADSFSTHGSIDPPVFKTIDGVPPPPPPSAASTKGSDTGPTPPLPNIDPGIMAQVTAVPVKDIKDTENLIKAARLHWRVGKVENKNAALEAYRLVLASEPNRSDVRIEYGERLIEIGKYADAVDTLSRAFRDLRNASTGKDKIFEAARSLVYALLYLTKPESFEKSLAMIDEVSREPGFVMDASWRIKRLAAKGQKLGYFGSKLTLNERDALRADIINDVQDVLAERPSAKKYLQGLIDPLFRSPDSKDNDLEALRNDAELRALVGLPPLEGSS